MTDRQRQQRFEHLLHEHRRIIFKVASVYARDAEDRQDLVQEICVQLWRAFARYDPARARLSTWIYRIALNVAISQLRRQTGALAGRMEPLEAYHLETIGGEVTGEPDERPFQPRYGRIRAPSELDSPPIAGGARRRAVTVGVCPAFK